MNGKERKKRVDRLAFLGTLAGGLAHEVKNPLSTMSVNLQLLKEEWADPQSPKEAKALKRVEILIREIGRLESIVNDFLNFVYNVIYYHRFIETHHVLSFYSISSHYRNVHFPF